MGIDLGIDSLFFADTILFHIKALVTHQFLVSANAKAETDAGDIQRQIKRCSEVRSCRFEEVQGGSSMIGFVLVGNVVS